MTKRRRRGQALIETSLVIITLLLMIIGIMDFGQFLFFHQALTDRARAGARYAVTRTCCSSDDITAIQNMVVYNDPAPGNGASPLFGLSSSYVTVVPTPATGTPSTIEVRISGFPIQLLSPFLSKSYTHRDIRVVRQAEGLGATN